MNIQPVPPQEQPVPTQEQPVPQQELPAQPLELQPLKKRKNPIKKTIYQIITTNRTTSKHTEMTKYLRMMI